jgi:hypothetical protein
LRVLVRCSWGSNKGFLAELLDIKGIVEVLLKTYPGISRVLMRYSRRCSQEVDEV